ncbi:RhtX/FptX family siderophore transporter [Sinorhizobium numidicum]|uniref:RhtX/FptX family siderophore transporter n=1 Tax=Sinorhizobium numidicum TaxID=680248 RepID=A0ABY8CRT3_9HYPH|nr:RhtX/FptX family siderophore transporter [Sinorhizobium numidicum]WEX75364.1 RhtX/FptX family siderophore transporter [Sinorhizobium numidicum]WEX81359.1 RhtX/FptX family siderophore transporter [Sinorhizobium numidicum]
MTIVQTSPAVQDGPIARSAGKLYGVLGGLYLAQGIPSYLLLVALPPLMRESGASRTAIGLFSLLMLPLVLKFAIAPLVDRWALWPSLGHRRGWVVPTQLLVSAGIASMALVEPSQAGALFAIGICITLLSSVQDIATDGYAVRHLTRSTRPIGNAVQAGSVALGVIIGGTLTLVLFHKIGWRPTILLVACLSLMPLAAAIWMRDRAEPSPDAAPRKRASLLGFFHRPNAWMILAFALTYRASEGLVRGMEGPYLVDNKVPTDWIGYMSGGAAATAGLLGAVIAALIIRKVGLTATLILLGGLRSLCFLAFALNAFGVWPGIAVAMSASAFQTLIRYMELVAIYSFFMASSSDDQPGTDFTILSCAELVVYLIGTSIAGYLADRLGYEMLFSSATVISVLGIGLSVWMLEKIKARPAPLDHDDFRSKRLKIIKRDRF